MDNEQPNHHNNTNDCIRKCHKGASNESNTDLVNSKERKEIQNTQILCRTLSGNSCASSANKPTLDYKSKDTINEEGHSSKNTGKAQRGNNHAAAADSSCSDSFETTSISTPNKNYVNGTVVLNSLAAVIEQECESTKDKNRELSCQDFAPRQAELQSMEVDEEKPDVKTPVYEDMDPAQAILSHHRLAAYLASPDCPPDCLTPGAASLSTPSADVIDSADATGTVADKPLAVGRCGPELAEAALQSAGTVTRLPNNTVAFVADDLHQKIKLASPSSAGSGASTPMFGFHSHPYLGPHMMGATPPYSSASTPQSLAAPPYPYDGRHLPLDHTLLNDIEKHARRLATNVDGLIESLTDSLHGISALTVDCVETYRDTVCKTCDAVDANIKSMYQLMAKAEELSKAMKPVYGLHAQIKDVRRTLDLLEAEMHSSGS